MTTIFTTAIKWDRSGDSLCPYLAHLNGKIYKIRLNDFPEEPMYSLLMDGEVVESFDSWPKVWHKPAHQK